MGFRKGYNIIHNWGFGRVIWEFNQNIIHAPPEFEADSILEPEQERSYFSCQNIFHQNSQNSQNLTKNHKIYFSHTTRIWPDSIYCEPKQNRFCSHLFIKIPSCFQRIRHKLEIRLNKIILKNFPPHLAIFSTNCKNMSILQNMFKGTYARTNSACFTT